MGHRLAAIYAHPDDDTYSNGGVLLLSKGEVDYTLIVATRGEAGPIGDPSLATRENLASVREAEERAALEALGHGGAAVHFLGFPDGGLTDASRAEIVEAIVLVLREARPHVVVTFGPEGVTKHPDHVAIGQAATDAFHEARSGQEEADDGAFARLFYCGLPQSAIDRFWAEAERRGIDVGGPDDPLVPRGVPDHTIAVRVDCNTVVDGKLEAIRAHRTQRGEFDALPEDLNRDILGQECFVRAWPPVSDPEPRVLTGLFEGLPG